MTGKKREAGNVQEVGGSEGPLLARSALMLGWLRGLPFAKALTHYDDRAIRSATSFTGMRDPGNEVVRSEHGINFW